MSAGNLFSIGEFVKRRTDGRIGKVKRMTECNDKWMYYVQFDPRDKSDANPGGTWAGYESEWERASNVHAHVNTESRDCDGKYTGGYIAEMTLEERCAIFGELRFKGRVLTNIVTLHGHGMLDVTPEGLGWYEQTDEGYSAASVLWCKDECSERSWQRDHSAEAAGY